MKRKYAVPVIEKIVFDYREQISCTEPKCSGSVINVSHGVSICDDGTPAYIGWNLKNPGEIGAGN